MKRFAAVLLFAAILFVHIGPAAAQVQTYSYTGPAFDGAACHAAYPSPPPTCGAGPITGSVTLAMPAGYSGGIGESGILAYSFVAGGVGSVANGIFNPNEYNHYDFTNGQLVTWDTDVFSNS
jgi:hypothetical protein